MAFNFRKKKKITKENKPIKETKKSTKRKSLIPKTRNAGTMTEAAFWGWVRSGLRARSIYWKPIREVKEDAKRVYFGTNKNQKWEYQCSICKGWFMGKNIEIDHTIPCGSCNKESVAQFIENLFCEKEHLRVLCKSCHLEVTKKQKEKQ